ncbi:MAG: hypothetical protein JSR48_08150 [Verrucomicrobia bacterium]|nr:hypothetical protein [Verrucomicrobiota bacterium]
MVSKLALALFAMFLAGCSSAVRVGLVGPSEGADLASNRRLPGTKIEKFYSPVQWAKIREMKFAGYVRAEGEILGSRLSVRKLRESFPDTSRDVLARRLLDEVELKAPTVGTNISPRGLAWVIFYERNPDGDLAIIYAKQSDESVPGDLVGAEYFCARRY